jgi:isoquinoline 1-oxidoreductase beta subunit
MLQDTNALALSPFVSGQHRRFQHRGRLRHASSTPPPPPFNPNAWVTIGEDGIVTIVGPMVEMGQGVRVAALILAEDLDADGAGCASRRRRTMTGLRQPIFNNQLTTVGSFSVTGYYEKLRLAGAQARKILTPTRRPPGSASQRAPAPSPAWCAQKSNRRSATATSPRPRRCRPAAGSDEGGSEASSQFRLIGRDAGRIDVPSKVSGTAQYGIDVQLPGMLYASVLFRRCSTRRPSRSTMPRRKPSGVVKDRAAAVRRRRNRRGPSKRR